MERGAAAQVGHPVAGEDVDAWAPSRAMIARHRSAISAIARLNPFKTPETQRLALLFAVVYFAQGMWALPTQAITIVLKERGLSAGQVADLFAITIIPWLIKPIYGLLSDFVPLWGQRRKSYFLLSSALAAGAGAVLAAMEWHSYARLAVFFTAMALGLAFNDVLTDAVMVENGRPRNLTGAFQSVQWAAVNAASILVGVLGGYLAELRNLRLAFGLASCFPLIALGMAVRFLHEETAPVDRETFRRTWQAIREALREPELWAVAGFIFFFNFSPSFGPAFLYYQTDALKFSQPFIGVLASLNSVGAIVGAAIYAPLSRRIPLKRLIVGSIGVAAAGTLAYLGYVDSLSAIVISVGFGLISMVTQLAFLDLAAKSCPQRIEGTFFALLMSVFNGGAQLSTNVGARLYDRLGYAPLVWISAAVTALAWLLVPLVRIDRIEARARGQSAAVSVGERRD